MQRIALLALLLLTATVQALPPLGLTQVATNADSTSKLAVIDGVAYVSHHVGISLIGETGLAETIVPQSSIFQSPYQPTRAVRGEDGGVYVGMNFNAGGEFGDGGSSLYRLSAPNQAITNWDGYIALGFSSQLWGVGRSPGTFWGDVRLLSDNSGPIVRDFVLLSGGGFYTTEVLPGGLVVGDTAIPGTLGSAGAIIDRDDNLQFIADYGSTSAARERADGDGTNVSYNFGNGIVLSYGSRGWTSIDGVSPPLGYGSVQVTETDFALLGRWSGSYSVFFPGVNAAGDDLSVPLLEFFPELNALDFDYVTDIVSAGGQIHLLLSGDDGLWLYSAVDPTWVPEPNSALLMACALAPWAYRRRA